MTKQFNLKPELKSILFDTSLSPHERVLRYMAACGGSLRGLAAALGCHYMHLYEVLGGKRQSNSLKRRIARYLGVDISTLWPEAVEKKDAA